MSAPLPQMLVKARCSLRGEHFAVVFVRGSSDCWEAQSTFKITAGRAEKGYQQGSMNNVVVGAGYTGCPHCSNRSFFVCNGCKTINCLGAAKREGERTYIQCAGCKGGGYLEGRVEKIEGFGDL